MQRSKLATHGSGAGDSGRPAAVIHMDLDGCQHIYRMHGWRYDDHDDPLFHTGLTRALDFLDQANVTATLFLIAEDLDDPRKRELLQDAVDRGHEIASHTLTHRKLTTLSPSDKRREIFESREKISSELGVEVDGFRAPGFHIDQECFQLIEEAGYTYDSSLFPTTRSRRKIVADQLSLWPGRPIAEQSLMELPLPQHGPLPKPFHPCYSLVLGYWYFHLGTMRFLRTGAPLVLLFHLTDFAEPVTSDRLPGWKAKILTLSHLSAQRKRRCCDRMLSAIQRYYEIVETRTLIADLGAAMRSQDRVSQGKVIYG